ncbi:hypothetical protein L083_2453 [Actinoplanes sp. N902-109]|nr:hypothetical protein L083_2453 [Actinoplanes sp. N902-109]
MPAQIGRPDVVASPGQFRPELPPARRRTGEHVHEHGGGRALRAVPTLDMKS